MRKLVETSRAVALRRDPKPTADEPTRWRSLGQGVGRLMGKPLRGGQPKVTVRDVGPRLGGQDRECLPCAILIAW